MSEIIITLNKNDIGNLLLGGEIQIATSVSRFDNLQRIVMKYDDYYNCFTVEEDWNDSRMIHTLLWKESDRYGIYLYKSKNRKIE